MTSGKAIESVPEDTPLGSTFRENAAKIYRFIYAKVGNREAAEDLTSQVFLKAVRWLAQDHSAVLFCGWEGPEEVRRTRERAWRILDALPEREREVLRLRFLHGYTAGEIGREMGLTADHVRVLQLRALRRAAMCVDLEPRAPDEIGAERSL